ncbi:MAG: 3-hydroxyacyl-CoA dehydrogenase family protein [Rhizobium sp.]|nr:3-hydroxyacyl-CoA dehydrogenase family protein [Rhizobium sp.]
MSGKERIAVIGAGLMGHGIAQVFAVAGHDVAVYDANKQTLDSVRSRIARNLADLGLPGGAEARVHGFGTIEGAVEGADFIVEAAPERVDLKQAIFSELVEHAPRDAILASNTSVIPISAIAVDLDTADRILGTHWWNPPFLVPLVEVVGTRRTTAKNIERAIALLTSVGKTAVHVKKDVAGFVGNRLQHALWREAIAIVAEGIADARTVDTVVKASFGRRLAVLGPIENADLVGTDLTLDIHNVVLQHLNKDPRPSPYLEELVRSGRLGMKSGEGFRTWTDEESTALRARVFQYLNDFDRL